MVYLHAVVSLLELLVIALLKLWLCNVFHALSIWRESNILFTAT